MIVTIICSIIYVAILYFVIQADPDLAMEQPALIMMWLSSTVIFYVCWKTYHLLLSKYERLTTSPFQYQMWRLGFSGGTAILLGLLITGFIFGAVTPS
jgi:O-antigen/teichoic acid export membrane protein